MLLADQLPPAIAVVIGMAIFIALGAIVLLLFRGYETFAQQALSRRYAGLAIHSPPEPGDVILVFHTYHGLIAWFTQTPHVVALPAEDARVLLGRLLRFNLTWGLFTAGAIFVPPLSIMHYIGQRRSITRQHLEGGIPADYNSDQTLDSPPATEPVKDDNPYAATQALTDSIRSAPRRSTFHQILGWTCAGLCAVFGVVAFTQAVQGKFDGAAGGVLFAVLLGWLARDFVKNTTFDER